MFEKEVEKWIDLPYLSKFSVEIGVNNTYRIYGYDTVLKGYIRYAMDETEDEIKLYDLTLYLYSPEFRFPKRRATQTYYESCLRTKSYKQLTEAMMNHPQYRLSLVTGAKKISKRDPDASTKSLRYLPWLGKNLSFRHWFFLSMTGLTGAFHAPYVPWVAGVCTGILTLVTAVLTWKDLRAIKTLLKKGEETHES